MNSFRITLLAQADIDSAWLFIAKDRPEAASRLLKKFQTHFDLIARNPAIGQERFDLASDVRQSTVGGYVVLHRVRTEYVEILRVIHGARDIAAEFKRHWPQRA